MTYTYGNNVIQTPTKHTDEDLQKQLQELHEHFQPDRGSQSLKSVMRQVVGQGFSSIPLCETPHKITTTFLSRPEEPSP